jgi:energy-coupling factor transport system permease protein
MTDEVPPARTRSFPSASRPANPYERLNPLTKLVVALVTSAHAIVTGGLVGPILLFAVLVILPGLVAGILWRLLRTSLLLTLPLAISILVVNVFFYPAGADVLFRVGPLAATREGLTFALEVVARLGTIGGAVALFYLTTRPAELVADLERRGASSRVTFVTTGALQTIPVMVERAGAITAAQRARGLDTEGSAWRRVRGVVPIVGPVILGSITDVEERSMALEARGFTRPGRRTLLWAPGDSDSERALRWVAFLSLPGVLVARAAGLV